MNRPGSRLCAALVVTVLAAGAAHAQQPRSLRLGLTRLDSLTATDPVSRTRRAPYHLWTFDGRRGERVAIDMVSGDFDSYLALRDPDGMPLLTDDDGGEGNNARIRTILPRDGRYRILATAYTAEARGQYSLLLTGWESPPGPEPGAIGALRRGQSGGGSLEPGDSIGADGPFEDHWTFEARAGDRLRVELRSEDFDAFLSVLGPDGRVLGTDDDGLGGNNSSVSVRARLDGRYTALVSSYGENLSTGAYTVSLHADSGTFADPGVAATIAPGETRQGRLEDGDESGPRGFQDNWTFTGRAGQVVRLDVRTQLFDPYVLLLHEGMPVDSNDDGGEGTNARLTVSLPGNGRYTAVVSAYTQGRSTGRYDIALALATAPAGAGQVARITPGQSVSGRLEAGDRTRGEGGAYEDWFEFEGRAGQQVTMEMRSPDFDTYLELHDAAGAVLAQDDDGLDGTDSFIMTSLPANGRYRIVARSFGESAATGLYDLALAVAAPAAPAGRLGELRVGQTVGGRLEYGDSVLGDSTYADIYLYRAESDGNIAVELSSSDFDAYLILRDADGRTIATDDDGASSGTNALIIASVAAGRTYRILANSFGTERSTGTYRVSLRWSP